MCMDHRNWFVCIVLKIQIWAHDLNDLEILSCGVMFETINNTEDVLEYFRRMTRKRFRLFVAADVKHYEFHYPIPPFMRSLTKILTFKQCFLSSWCRLFVGISRKTLQVDTSPSISLSLGGFLKRHFL